MGQTLLSQQGKRHGEIPRSALGRYMPLRVCVTTLVTLTATTTAAGEHNFSHGCCCCTRKDSSRIEGGQLHAVVVATSVSDGRVSAAQQPGHTVPCRFSSAVHVRRYPVSLPSYTKHRVERPCHLWSIWGGCVAGVQLRTRRHYRTDRFRLRKSHMMVVISSLLESR